MRRRLGLYPALRLTLLSMLLFFGTVFGGASLLTAIRAGSSFADAISEGVVVAASGLFVLTAVVPFFPVQVAILFFGLSRSVFLVWIPFALLLVLGAAMGIRLSEFGLGPQHAASIFVGMSPYFAFLLLNATLILPHRSKAGKR